MECFGFELTPEGEIEDGDWRQRRGRHSGRISRVRAVGHGYEIVFLVKHNSATGYIMPEGVMIWPADGVLEEAMHKYPWYAPGDESGGRICHELRFPVITGDSWPYECRVSELGQIAELSPDFVSEMARLGVGLELYEDAVAETNATGHQGHYCVVLPEVDPLLICAVFIGEKMIPWLRASQ